MSNHGVCFAGISELAAQYADGSLSPLEVTRVHLERIESLEPHLHAFMRVLAESALGDAERATKEIREGQIRGPLHGVPIGVKDLFFTAGVPTTAGMWIRREFRPDFDATVVRRLREAGAVLLGKLSLSDGAMTENHPRFPTPVNPWRADAWAGASSNGSAVATAAGLCTATLASDTGGSIRLPCAMNGVTGIKPTWGRVSVHGAFGLAPSLDHVGPIARSAEDAGHVLQVIAGPDPDDPVCLRDPVPDSVSTPATLRGVRIGLDPQATLDRVEPAVRAVLEGVISTLEQSGAVLVDVGLPPTDPLASLWAPYCSAAAAVLHEETFPAQEDEYGPFLREFLNAGRAVRGTEIAPTEIERRRFVAAMDAVFEEVDLLLLPVLWRTGLTLEGLSEAASTPEGIASLARFTAPLNFSGHPTITMPGGMGDDGVPIGFQLVAPHLAEARLVAAGRTYQAATRWHREPPPIEASGGV